MARQKFGRMTAMENIHRGIAKDAFPTPIWFRITCQSRVRRSRRGTGRWDIYITKVDLDNGSTSSVKHIWYTPHKDQAQKFGKLSAETISKALNGKGWGLSTRVEPIEGEAQ